MGGSADITTITHQQASESLEETLIAPKLTKIEFPQFLRKVSASSSVVVMNDWLLGEKWRVCGQDVMGGRGAKGALTLCQLCIGVKYMEFASQSFVVSKSRCTVCMYVCGTVRAPRCRLIDHLPSHQSPTPRPVRPLQRGNQRRSRPERKKERKTQKKVKRRNTHVYEPFNTQFTKDQKTGASLFLANSNLIQARRRRTIKL